ncbi:MAG: TonB family protein [Acidobacteriaceae bacterium]
MPARSSTDLRTADTAPFGWRAANLLAVASPYLVAASLLLGLELTRPPAPLPAQIANSAPPPSATGPSVVADTHDGTVPPASPDHPQPDSRLPDSRLSAQRAQNTLPHGLPPTGTLQPGRPDAQPGADQAPRTQPVPVDPLIAGTMKLSGARPLYPAIARAARIEGTVVLALTIGPDGSVRDVRALSGPVLLEPSAVDAVRSWRYRPWLVAGHAVPFTTQFSIDFKLDFAPPQ